MNHLQISTDPTLLGADLLPESLTTSPSVSTFLPEEDASTCLLLPETPSPPLDFSHPLTPSMGNAADNRGVTGDDDPAAETSSSSGSSGIGMVGTVGAGTGNLFSHNTYQHLRKKSDVVKVPDGSMHHAASLGIAVTKDMPGFVHWNWPLIRKCTFFGFLTVIVAMVGIVVAMIATLPKSCNPPAAWYKGSVFYEVFPASFQDTNDDGLGDIRGLIARVEYFQTLGIAAVRLNSIFPSKHYPDHFQEVTSLVDVDGVLGKLEDVQKLTAALHERNISLVLDLPIYPFLGRLSPPTLDVDHLPNRTDGGVTASEFLRLSRSVTAGHPEGNVISDVLRFWLTRAGVDGFYVKGLEHFADDPLLVENVKEWKYLLGPDRVLMVSQKLVELLPERSVRDVLSQVDLVDAYLDVANGTDAIAKTLQEAIGGKLLRGVDHPWIHWSLGSVSERRLSSGLSPNATLAATLLELTLPGTVSIFYGDEIALEEAHDPADEHGDTRHLHHLAGMVWDSAQNQFTSRGTLPWLPRSASASLHHLDYVIEAIALRRRSPSIYLNAVVKEQQVLPNADVKSNQNDILIVQRWYPRRNSFAAIANLGPKRISLDLTAMFYSGEIIAGSSLKHERVYFDRFEISPLETIIVKLHK
ncbi:neutral and basic amino acid transport protein rBAT-like [Anopheles bellator]|uniref:neutral and basic amino acid transport protein rBAT-like n=1 Tax=Anopheles bellator TaxID=139047 RepID=UPI0026492518|nr:neutral and basic amino acid transport protein rBAT-like [Anopheles bellator]